MTCCRRVKRKRQSLTVELAPINPVRNEVVKLLITKLGVHVTKAGNSIAVNKQIRLPVTMYQDRYSRAKSDR